MSSLPPHFSLSYSPGLKLIVDQPQPLPPKRVKAPESRKDHTRCTIAPGEIFTVTPVWDQYNATDGWSFTLVQKPVSGPELVQICRELACAHLGWDDWIILERHTLNMHRAHQLNLI